MSTHLREHAFGTLCACALLQVVRERSTKTAMGQKITTAQFYVYGKKSFTRTGWQKAQTGPAYQPQGFLEEVDLAGKVFCVTGANSGIGKELTQFLSSRRAKVYMVRSYLSVRSRGCAKPAVSPRRGVALALILVHFSPRGLIDTRFVEARRELRARARTS